MHFVCVVKSEWQIVRDGTDCMKDCNKSTPSFLKISHSDSDTRIGHVINFVQWGVSICNRSLKVHACFCIHSPQVWAPCICPSPQLLGYGLLSTRHIPLNGLHSVFPARAILKNLTASLPANIWNTLKGHERTWKQTVDFMELELICPSLPLKP